MTLAFAPIQSRVLSPAQGADSGVRLVAFWIRHMLPPAPHALCEPNTMKTVRSAKLVRRMPLLVDMKRKRALSFEYSVPPQLPKSRYFLPSNAGSATTAGRRNATSLVAIMY